MLSSRNIASSNLSAAGWPQYMPHLHRGDSANLATHSGRLPSHQPLKAPDQRSPAQTPALTLKGCVKPPATHRREKTRL